MEPELNVELEVGSILLQLSVRQLHGHNHHLEELKKSPFVEMFWNSLQQDDYHKELEISFCKNVLKLSCPRDTPGRPHSCKLPSFHWDSWRPNLCERHPMTVDCKAAPLKTLGSKLHQHCINKSETNKNVTWPPDAQNAFGHSEYQSSDWQTSSGLTFSP